MSRLRALTSSLYTQFLDPYLVAPTFKASLTRFKPYLFEYQPTIFVSAAYRSVRLTLLSEADTIDSAREVV